LALLDALAADASTDERANAALALLGDDDEGAAEASDHQSDGDLAADLAPGDIPASGADTDSDAVAVEPGASSAIEAPSTLSPELRERFKALPPDLQQTLAQWETERNRGVNARLEEAATIRKANEAEQTAAKSERQQLAQHLERAIQLSTQFNPVIAEGLKMTQADWLNLARTDKAAYVERRAEFEAAVGQVQEAQRQFDGLREKEAGERGQAHQATVAQEMGKLATAMPELVDPKTNAIDVGKAKAFAGEVNTLLTSHGFSPAEIGGLSDHRMLLVVRDAMRWRSGEKTRVAALAKQTVVVPRVVRPGSGAASTGDARSTALANKARNATSTSDQADAIARMLD
jgi:hypothetical protein